MKLGLYDKISGNLIDAIPDGEVSGYMLDQYFILRGEKQKGKIKVGKIKKPTTYTDIEGKEIAGEIEVPTVNGVEYSPMLVVING